MLAIFVKRGEVWEWSAKAGEWMRLDPEGTFTDRTLARPLSIKALLHAAEADNAVAQALVAKGNPVLMQMIAQGEKKGLLEGEKKGLLEGEKQGLRTAIESACASFAIELTEEKRAQISELDPAGLKALLTSIYAERRLP